MCVISFKYARRVSILWNDHQSVSMRGRISSKWKYASQYTINLITIQCYSYASFFCSNIRGTGTFSGISKQWRKTHRYIIPLSQMLAFRSIHSQSPFFPVLHSVPSILLPVHFFLVSKADGCFASRCGVEAMLNRFCSISEIEHTNKNWILFEVDSGNRTKDIETLLRWGEITKSNVKLFSLVP